MDSAMDTGSLQFETDELNSLLTHVAEHTVPEFVCMFGSVVGSVLLLVFLTFLFYSNVSSFSEFMGAMYVVASLAYLFVIPTAFTALCLRFIESRHVSAVVVMLFALVYCTQLSLGEEGIVSNVMFLTFSALFCVSFSMLTAKVFKFYDDHFGRILCTSLSLFGLLAMTHRHCGGGNTFSVVWIVFLLLVCFPFELGYWYLRISRVDDVPQESRSQV